MYYLIKMRLRVLLVQLPRPVSSVIPDKRVIKRGISYTNHAIQASTQLAVTRGKIAQD